MPGAAAVDGAAAGAGFAAAFFGAAFFAAGFAAAFFGAAFFAAAGFFGAAAAFLAAGFLAFFSSAIVNLHCMFEKGKINNPPTTARIIQQRRRTGIDEFKRFPQPSLGLQQDGGTRQLGFRQDWKVGKHGLACGENGGHDYGRGGIQPDNGLASIDYRAPCVFLHAPPFVGYCGKNCGSSFNYNLLYVVGQRPFGPNGSSSRFSMQDKLRVLCICMQKSVAVKPRDRSQTGSF